MTTKYIAYHNGKIVGTRKSAITHKTYSHAVVVWGHGKDGEVVTWCSRIDLAHGEQRKYQRYGFRAEIVEAQIIAPKKAQPKPDADEALDDFNYVGSRHHY
jgi:hypothetical protein